MAWKKLGAADLAATTNTSVYTVPADTETIANVNVCNRTAAAITVRLAIAEGATPGDEDYIEYDFSLAANDTMERTGVHMDAGMVVVAYAGAVDVSVFVHGNERSTL